MRLTAGAERELETAYLWYRENAPDRADRWYNGFLDALQPLEHQPEGFPLIPEQHLFGLEIRQVLYGSRHRWRGVFRGTAVLVLHLRHSAREPLGPGDLP